MNNKFYSLDSKITKTILLHGNSYPVHIQGSGKIPCLCIGTGSLMQKTLSDKFKTLFTVYSTDTYWVKKHRIANPLELSISSIVEDTLETARQLGFEKYVLIGVSCFGIVALEVAKHLPSHLCGVMAMATPPYWNQKSKAITSQYFTTHASKERKDNHQQRQATYAKIRKPDESEVSINGYEADSAKYWANFNISRAQIEELWDGAEADDAIMNHFFETLLPNFDLELGINKIQVPVVVVGGNHDYDCCPALLWKDFPKPQNYHFIDCGEAGHWPHFENAQLFDHEIEMWALKNSIL